MKDEEQSTPSSPGHPSIPEDREQTFILSYFYIPLNSPQIPLLPFLPHAFLLHP